MIVLIPLGGTGERFKKNYYKQPKALINVLGKPILYYLLDNLNFQNIDFVYIPYNKEYYNYRLEDRLYKDYPDIKFKFLKINNTKGAAETVKIALDQIKYDTSILCLDGDNFYTTDVINLWNGKNKIITFEDYNNNPIYSYVDIKNNQIVDIKEKEKISNYACTGAYGFSSIKKLHKYCKKVIDNNLKQKNEFYMSTVIKEMIKDNFNFEIVNIEKKYWNCLGTPIQVKQFCNNYPKISCLNNKEKVKKLRICFDLDNTLVTFPKIKNDYTSVEPINKNIDFLKYLKSFGHTIIIYTARKMKTHYGNVGKILYDVGKITFDTLEKFNIPFDEIYFGKPYADVYIDDLALNCFDDMEKYLGFYQDTIDPRNFNQLNKNTIDIFVKKSNNLDGEIFYYKNIPKEIKDMFPLFIDNIDNKQYTMEKVDGLTCSTLYLSELLNKDLLINILNSINRIQSVKIKNYKNDINIYSNYSKKLKERYESYNYNKFENSFNIYQDLKKKLDFYENNNKGKLSVIHGDPVMTNIIVNNYEKIKFIDMRGKLDNKLTIYGDWLYDWAKIYQSLIGYDKILLNKNISEEYEKDIILTFENYFINHFSKEYFDDLKLITKSLLFTLIPLHDNDKCYKYYQLINKI